MTTHDAATRERVREAIHRAITPYHAGEVSTELLRDLTAAALSALQPPPRSRPVNEPELNVRDWLERFLNPSNHDLVVARAQYGAASNPDVLRAQARGQIASDFELAMSQQVASTRAEERERCAKAAEAVKLPDRWLDGRALSRPECRAADDAAALIIDAIRALTPTPEPPHA